ncbi:uncharacterized protein LOC117747686 isoform X2 [Cyclopterus lumpus]|uniref:uncharacterized protein LOC117747686 isoform X2 n=1 Tax=Cyclopterus lumpus TaxID=8103 RepID=UPI0014866C3C|nr:uncharacterized protein LOC117747686 isoform X2 [Cyclopterus lumpus]
MFLPRGLGGPRCRLCPTGPCATPPSCPCSWLRALHTISPTVATKRVLDCFHLNTPTPVMSARPAPPTCPDPFRSGPYPTRDLGSLTLKVNTLHLPVQPRRVVLQLTQEEDQAVTNLLKLHHQEEPLHWGSAEGVEPLCKDVPCAEESSLQSQLQQGRRWSDTELEAANTLLSGFSLMENDNIWGQNHCKSVAIPPDPLLYRHPEDPSTNTETQHRSDYFPASITADCAQNDVVYIGFSCAREYGGRGWGDLEFVEVKNADVHLPVCESSLSSDSKTNRGSSAAGGLSEVKWALSDLEGDAVRMLLSLGDTGALAIVQ